MIILVTFTGFHDPYDTGLIGDEKVYGPILTLLQAKSFDKVILFSTPNTEKNTSDTKDAIGSLRPETEIEVIDLPLNDPTDYFAILRSLRKYIKSICDNTTDSEFFISVASGTPQMHACWLLLAASGEIPAHILHVRPPKFVTKRMPLIKDVDLTSSEFPIVKPNVGLVDMPDLPIPDINTAITKIGIVGDHPSMLKSIEIAAILAPSDVPILILGDTGTGKELFAKLIHLLSERPGGAFIPINCAAIPKDLVESILFGHKKGAFTGAISDQTGKFDLADGGTLFLDELADLPLPVQAKLLRVLQDGLVETVGEKKPHKVDVRLIAATNKNIGKAIKDGTFREDLYYRLNVGEVRLPPLRKRKSDIPKIALQILDRINATLKRHKRFSTDALTRLQHHNWPGNVRDLENVIERSVRLARRDVLEADDLLITEPQVKDDPLSALPEPSPEFSLDEFLTSARKQLILRALEIAGGNQSEAARLLGVTPQAVHKFLKT